MDLAQQLLACFQAQLQDPPHPKPIDPQYVMLRAGREVIPLLSTTGDECCRGLGWVRIASITGVRELNDTATTAGCFGQARTLTLELGTARCAPTPGASTIPTEDQWTAVALLLDEDNGAMERAICCAFADVDDVAVGTYEPFGQDGNCIGAVMTVNVAMEACCDD